MPIISIDAFDPTPEQVERTLPRMTMAVAEAVGAPPERVRAYFRPLVGNAMAQGPDLATSRQPSTHPPIVTIVARGGRSPELVEAALRAAAAVVEDELELEPGNSFVSWIDQPAGTVLAGGSL